MSASSSNSLPIPPDWMLPLMRCPLCGDDIESNVARTGTQAGNRFYKCVRYDARQCRFFEFQRAYWRRMSPMQIAAAQQQAGMHPGGQMFGFHHANAAAQLVPAMNQPQAQIHPQVQQAPPVGNNQIQHPPQAAAPASATGTQSLAVIAVLLGATNIMLTALVLMMVVASGN